MLFLDKLKEKEATLRPKFDILFESILKNQTHSADALLINVNGFYNPEVHNWKNITEKLSPYVIGPNSEGLSEQLHYKFIHNYRSNNIAKVHYPEYLKALEYSHDKRIEIDEAIEFEGTSIQLEMLVYLKIWEADAFIKKFYQATRLLHKEPYDWHFKIKESNRDTAATGNRDNIIRLLVRDKIKTSFPGIYSAFKNAFITQIRNSIAHSKYSFLGRNIHLNNFIASDPASQLKNVPFDQWVNIFHDTIIIYNEYLSLTQKINNHFAQIATGNNNQVEIRINRQDPIETIQFANLEFRPEFQDWKWQQLNME